MHEIQMVHEGLDKCPHRSSLSDFLIFSEGGFAQGACRTQVRKAPSQLKLGRYLNQTERTTLCAVLNES